MLFWSCKMNINKRNQATMSHFFRDFYSKILISLLWKDLAYFFFLQIISPAFEKILSQGTLVAGMQRYFLARMMYCCSRLAADHNTHISLYLGFLNGNAPTPQMYGISSGEPPFYLSIQIYIYVSIYMNLSMYL